MCLDRVVKLTVSYCTCCGDDQTDPDVSWPDVSWTDVSFPDVSGPDKSVTGRFVGLLLKILPHLPYALR